MSQTTGVAPAVADAGTPTSDPMDSFDINTDDMTGSEVEFPQHLVLGEEQPPEAAEAPPETEAEKATRERDEKGKFVKKAEPKTDEQKEPEETAQQEEPKPEARSPLKYRALGENHEAEGFEYNPEDGSVVVKPDAVGVLRDAMNARHVLAEGRDINEKLRGELATLQGQLADRQRVTTEAEARAKAFTDHMERLLVQADETQAIEEFFRLRSEWPVLKAQADAEHWKQRAASGKPAAPEKAEVPKEQQEPASPLPTREIATQTTQEYVQQIKLDHAFKDLTPENWKQLDARYERMPYAFLRPATAEEAQQYGVAQGQIVFDSDAFQADVTEYVTGLRQSRETVKDTAKLAVDNARRTTKSVDAPPTPAKGTAPAKERRGIRSEQDFDDWLDSNEI